MICLYYSILYNLHIKLHGHTGFISRVVNSLHSRVKTNVDVITTINRQRMHCDFNHKLAEYQHLFPKYDRQLSIICKFIENIKGKPLCIIDVGANVGDTVLNIGIKDAFYLLVEGNDVYLKYIKKNLNNYKYSLLSFYLSDKPNVLLSANSHDGTAFLRESQLSEGSKKSITLDDLLKKNYPNLVFDLLKIDTDGFDFKVLRGAQQTIRETTPFVYFEWDKMFLEEQGEDPMSIFPFLQECNYSTLIIFDNYGNFYSIENISNIENLRRLINNTRGKSLPFYFDVLACPFSFDDYVRDLQSILL